MKNKASALFDVQSILLKMIDRNSSAKHPFTIGVNLMQDQINCIVVGQEKILQAARVADVTLIQAGK